MVLLPLLLLPAFAASVRLNACGSDVTDYDNYLDVSINVPIELVADFTVGSPTSGRQKFKDLYDADFYRNYVESYHHLFHDDYFGNWTKMSDDIRSRVISSTFRTEVSFHMYQVETVNDAKQLVETVSTIKLENPGIIGQPALIDNYEIISRVCVSPGTRYEHDMRLTLPTEYAREKTKKKMIVVNNGLGKALKRLELVHKNYQNEFEFIETRPVIISRSERFEAPTFFDSNNDFALLYVIIPAFVILLLAYSCVKCCVE